MSAIATGYQPTRSPAATFGVVGVHLGLAALALVGLRVAVGPAPPPPIEARSLPTPPVPQPPPVAPVTSLDPIAAQVPQPTVDITPDRVPDPGIITIDRDPGLPRAEPGGQTGSGTTAHIDPPPVIAPTDAHLDPRYAARFQPPYPDASTRLGEEGTVVIRVQVGPDGRVIAAAVAQSSGHPRLDAAALARALSAWRFVPATRDGKPVEATRTVPVRFRLDVR